ncbi:hypothetical protein SprV_0401412500 [Sparganum proliferum]
MHSRSRHWHLLDFVVVQRRDQRDVLVTKAIPGADGWTDHRLVISEMRIRLQPHGRLQDNLRNNRPERRTALVAPELVRYKVDITAFIEARLSDQGQLEEVGASYTFFWRGRPRAERRDAGVAFVLRNEIVG